MLDIESLATPLSADAPSGQDLEYDPVFLALEQAGAGKPEQQFGDHIVAAEPPDWRAVQQHTKDLSQRTRDLRVAVWQLRCEARTAGITGAMQGLQLVHRLLSDLWDSVHPQLDASDNNDPTMRMNALAPLVSPEAALADLRAATFTNDRNGLSLRALELGLGKAEPGSDESVPSETGVRQGLAAALQAQPALAETIAAGVQAARDTAKLLDDKVSTAAPEFKPLLRLMQCLDEAVKAETGGAPAAAEGATDATGAPVAGAAVAAVAAPGSIVTRDDAIRMLDKVCDWIQRNEPGHPSPLLIRRAQRLMSKNFIEIIRDLAPDGIDQVERLAGPGYENN